MRLWSIHPKYLDSKGLIAAWREALLARHVLEGKTRGYKHHPQLVRFLAATDPTAAINVYLRALYEEAERRGYSFSRDKVDRSALTDHIPVTNGQLLYEWKHLLNKLETRDPGRYAALQKEELILPHPLFTVVAGGVEPWEIIPAAGTN